MSDAAASKSSEEIAMDADHPVQEQPKAEKGKSKAKDDDAMDEDVDTNEEEDDDDDDASGEDEDDEEMEEEEDLSGIDPSAILPRSRRARAPVDYASEEALRKAGLTREELEKEDEHD